MNAEMRNSSDFLSPYYTSIATSSSGILTFGSSAVTTTDTEISYPRRDMHNVIEEVFLHYQDERSNKGFVSRVLDEGTGTFSHYTAWGGVGRTFTQKVDAGLTLDKAKQAHLRKVTSKMNGATPYEHCNPAVLGQRAMLDTSVDPTPILAGDRPKLWHAMLYTAADTAKAAELIQDDNYFAQRKEDGNRARLFSNVFNMIRACNRDGREIPVPQVTADRAKELHQSIGIFDLDGEMIGNEEYRIFDFLQVPGGTPAISRYWELDRLRLNLPEGFTITETAVGTEAKQALLARAVAEGWEGLVFKRKTAPYHKGRSPLDFKFKLWNEVTVALTAVNRTSRSEYGSAWMEFLDPVSGEWRFVGNVASGFKQGELEALAVLGTMNAGSRPTPILADVRYLYYSGAALFQPAFRRFRNDIDPDLKTSLAHQAIYGRDGRKVEFP